MCVRTFPNQVLLIVSPSDAATWYKTNINPLAIKKALPAITSSTASNQGLDWLSQMINACAGGCNYDYINLVRVSHLFILTQFLTLYAALVR